MLHGTKERAVDKTASTAGQDMYSLPKYISICKVVFLSEPRLGFNIPDCHMHKEVMDGKDFARVVGELSPRCLALGSGHT